MITIRDYDSGFQIDSKVTERLEKMSGILVEQLNTIPIFFVKRDTIDRYNTTPSLNRECAKENVMALSKYMEETDFSYHSDNEKKQEQRKFKIKEFVDMQKEKLNGCLIQSDTIACFIATDDDICKGPHILVCDEKINYTSPEEFVDLLIFIILHELTHAFFLSKIELKDVYNHIIEESLCEAYAFSRFDNVNNIFDFVTDPRRPPEYTAFKFWLDPQQRLFFDHELIFVMSHWRSNKDKGFIYSVIEYSRFNNHRFIDYKNVELIYFGGLPFLAMLVLMFA